MQRANGNLTEAYNLRLYYDEHVVPQVPIYSSADWKNVGLDIVSLTTSVIGINPVARALKLGKSSKQLVNAVYLVTGTTSTRESYQNGSGPEIIFNILGFVPGLVGAVGSAGSLVLDMIPDVTFSPYEPPVPR